MIQNFDHPSCKILITGTSGTGKTTLFQKLVKAERARLKFVYDHQGEFSMRFGVPGVSTPEQLIEATNRTGWIVYDPVRMFPGKSPDGFAFFCDFVMEVSASLKGRKLFCCDELQKLISSKREPDELLALLDTGRRYSVDFYAISQAPNRIHNGVRNQLTRLYTFRQSDENAVKFLADNGFSDEAIRTLSEHRYLWRDLGTGETGQG